MSVWNKYWPSIQASFPRKIRHFWKKGLNSIGVLNCVSWHQVTTYKKIHINFLFTSMRDFVVRNVTCRKESSKFFLVNSKLFFQKLFYELLLKLKKNSHVTLSCVFIVHQRFIGCPLYRNTTLTKTNSKIRN